MEQMANVPDEEQFVVRNLKEIIQILTEMSKQNIDIKLSFNSGNDVCLTRVISVDTKRNVVYLDTGIDEGFNTRLLAADYVLFNKDYGVRVRWSSKQVSIVNLPDGKALKIAIPQSVVRLQRREYFRLATPVVNPVACQIPVPDDENPGSNKMLSFALVDISLGGVGLVTTELLDPSIEIGASFNGCQIDFPDIGKTNLTLQVKNVVAIPVKEGVVKHRIGLCFVNPSTGNSGLIHRYTFNLEREYCSRTWNPMG